LKVKLGTALLPALAGAAKGLTNFVQQAIQGKGAGGALKAVVVTVAKAVKDLAKDLMPLVKGVSDFAKKNPEVVKFALAFAAVAVAGLKLAKMIETVSVAFGVLEAVLAPLEIELLPFIAVILVIAGLAFLIYKNWKPIKKFFTDLWNGVKIVTVTVWNGLKGFFTGAWGFIKGLFSSAASFISSAAKRGFLGPIPFIISHWNSIWTFLKRLFSTITGFLGGAVGKIAGLAKSIGTGLWHGFTSAISGIGGFVSGIFNSIPNTIKSVINAVIRHINGAVDHVNSISGKIGITLPHVPYLARGGIVTGGTMAVIGEDGPEAVIPLSSKHRAQGAALYKRAGEMMGMNGGHTFVVNNYGGDIDETVLAARMAWQLKTRAGLA
jgi:phage-related protein